MCQGRHTRSLSRSLLLLSLSLVCLIEIWKTEIIVGEMAAMRAASRQIFRRFSTSGKVLSEEEKAAENVYIKKHEREKLEKLARKGAKLEEQLAAEAGGAAATEATASTAQAGSSTEKSTNYLAIGGGVAALVAVGWYFGSRSKNSEEVKN